MSKVEKSYDIICDKWQEFRQNTQVNKCIADFCNYLKPNSDILDIGCGTGYPIDKYLCKKGHFVTGIDVSSKMIEKAKSLNLTNAQFEKADILYYKTTKKFDSVIAFDSIWHIDYDKHEQAFFAISQMLKKDGYFIFTHGAKDGEAYGTMWVERFYHSALDLQKLLKVLKENFFEVITLTHNYIEPTGGNRDLVVVARKM